jgi:ArsR family transcriptional regulator
MKSNTALFKALGDETRFCIVKKLLEGEKDACQIIPCSTKSQPTVSLHLKVLTDAGILAFRKVGKKRRYSLADARVEKIMKILED